MTSTLAEIDYGFLPQWLGNDQDILLLLIHNPVRYPVPLTRFSGEHVLFDIA